MIQNAASDLHDGGDPSPGATVESAVAYSPTLKWR